jgi:hypothetical protein
MSSSKAAKRWMSTAELSPSDAASSSSSRQSLGHKTAYDEHIPFTISLLLTALKCATALRSACPMLALQVVSSVGRSRIKLAVEDHSDVVRQHVADTPESTAELRQQCMKLGSSTLRARLQGILAVRSTGTAEDRWLRRFLEMKMTACCRM